jgi:hypothetical protein
MCSSASEDSNQLNEQARTESFPDMLYDELVSDEDYVVIEGKDVGLLIEELRANGQDDLGASGDAVTDGILSAAERVAMNREMLETAHGGGASSVDVGSQDLPATSVEPRESPGVFGSRAAGAASAEGESTMQYFTDKNMSFMPSWARTAFLDGKHEELEVGASRIGLGRGTGRLEAILVASKANDLADIRRRVAPLVGDIQGGASEMVRGRGDTGRLSAAEEVGIDPEDWKGAGILDCSVSDVADDYNVPVELVADIMLVYGVQLPIKPYDDIRDRLTMEEIERMLELITSFDAMDLSDRYSDQTITELAEDYDVDVDAIVFACEAEGVFLIFGKDTRLQLSREDRILDIARGRASPGGHEYPSLLHGLVVGDNPLPSSTFVQS